MIKVNIDGQIRMIPAGTILQRLAPELASGYTGDIVLATVNGKLTELHARVEKAADIHFITTADKIGASAYERSMNLLLNRAVYDLIPIHRIGKVDTRFSVTRGLYVEIDGDVVLDQDFLDRLKARMQELVQADLPIVKSSMRTEDAMNFFSRVKMEEKAKLFRYRRNSTVNIYSLDGFVDYFYGYMVPSTGILKYFDLMLYHDGLVVLLPDPKSPYEVSPLEPHEKLFGIMEDTVQWGEQFGMATVGDVNDKIAGGELSQMILTAEARQEAKISDIAEQIASDRSRKIVLIAGPSSSGKTSFSYRLSVQLLARGLKPHPLAVDDYFVNREDNPVDENGNYDFEALECVDIDLFNKDMNALLAGETIQVPSFNFAQGMREYRGKTMVLKEGDILVVEGIHCLNEKLTAFIPSENKFKIYVSALTPLKIDEHNRIPTTDGRLIRRMIRDARTRGASARDTIARWASVRRGEDRNIFPYQESADVMFNSSLIYEFSVMKSYAEQLLFSIPQDAPEYIEARRLLKFFDYFLAVDSTQVPSNSLLKEFIGGSIFPV